MDDEFLDEPVLGLLFNEKYWDEQNQLKYDIIYKEVQMRDQLLRFKHLGYAIIYKDNNLDASWQRWCWEENVCRIVIRSSNDEPSYLEIWCPHQSDGFSLFERNAILFAPKANTVHVWNGYARSEIMNKPNLIELAKHLANVLNTKKVKVA